MLHVIRDVIELSRVEFENFGTDSFKGYSKQAELELEQGFKIFGRAQLARYIPWLKLELELAKNVMVSYWVLEWLELGLELRLTNEYLIVKVIKNQELNQIVKNKSFEIASLKLSVFKLQAKNPTSVL
jgi:hypothetical protein